MWNVSNMLSMLRMVMSLPLSIALYHGNVFWIVTLALSASATDWLDGFFARKLNQVTDYGKIIDPLADKVMVIAGGLALVLAGVIPLWFCAVIILRDVLILLGGMFVQRKYGLLLMSNMFGKYAVGIVSLVLMLLAIRVDEYKAIMLFIATSMLAISFLLYAKRFVEIVKGGT